MDELELLKKDWKNNNAQFKQVSENEIYGMLHKSSSSIVKWIFIISILEIILWTSLGFLTNKLDADFNTGKKLCSIFIPTTPNPTTGYLILIPESDCKVIDITTQEAMTMIISGGIVIPNKLTNK